MKNLLSFLVLVALVLLQSTVLNLNLLLLFVIWQGRYYWAFAAGLLLDLLSGQRLGLSGLLYLFIVLLFRLYSRKFEPRAPFLAVFVFLSSFIFAKIENQFWHWSDGLLLSLLILIFSRRFRKETQLKLDL